MQITKSMKSIDVYRIEIPNVLSEIKKNALVQFLFYYYFDHFYIFYSVLI